ncbi:MAG: acetylxylan esterase [Planctomycetes bacterium]|nr:acetylxylan esterase [Planctomycetota bacterium]
MTRKHLYVSTLSLATLALLTATCSAQPSLKELTDDVRKINPSVVSPEDKELLMMLRTMLAREIRARRDAVNRRETLAWTEVHTRQDWERYRAPRLEALRKSLGAFPADKKSLNLKITGNHRGNGYVIDNVIYESRPGLLVTANLYRPAEPRKSMPGILICHSHHNPKTQGELQDMGVMWARAGCLVLVIDQLGHGERRQHPFIDAKSFAGAFKPGRQDYYFRYNVAQQLHLVGESLMGWMVWDMMRGVDLLLSRPGIDPKRILLLGAVAGGGDPCAVTAALDERIAAAVPVNFGGPQPETRFPLPDDAVVTFNYAGGGSWESTRNLRLSCRDGFLPWAIVGSMAPRGLVYGHEFAWDQERDPVWKRLQAIYGFYKSDRLAFAIGKGKLSGQPPESSHCNNIGAIHRQGIHAAFKNWFGIPLPEEGTRDRLSVKDLRCLTADAEVRLTPVHELATKIARERLAKSPGKTSEELRRAWANILGDVEAPDFGVGGRKGEKTPAGIGRRGRVLSFKPEAGDAANVVPLLLLMPPKIDGKLSAVVAIAQQGKRAFLEQRAEAIAGLLDRGIAVCLPDLRGCGETAPGGGRGRASTGTSLSATELMLGRTMLGNRLRDLRAVLRYLKSDGLIEGDVGVWAESFAAPNPPDRDIRVPWDAAALPTQAEPGPALLALLGALFEKDIVAVHAGGGLASFESVLKSPFLWLPHDAIVPGALAVSELSDITAAVAPQPVQLAGLIDGVNRQVSLKEAREIYRLSRNVRVAAEVRDADISMWFARQLLQQ